MSYSINRWNGTLLKTVADGTVDTSLDIKLIGKSYAGYGQAQNENFVHLLEHFSFFFNLYDKSIILIIYQSLFF